MASKTNNGAKELKKRRASTNARFARAMRAELVLAIDRTSPLCPLFLINSAWFCVPETGLPQSPLRSFHDVVPDAWPGNAARECAATRCFIAQSPTSSIYSAYSMRCQIRLATSAYEFRASREKYVHTLHQFLPTPFS